MDMVACEDSLSGTVTKLLQLPNFACCVAFVVWGTPTRKFVSWKRASVPEFVCCHAFRSLVVDVPEQAIRGSSFSPPPVVEATGKKSRRCALDDTADSTLRNAIRLWTMGSRNIVAPSECSCCSCDFARAVAVEQTDTVVGPNEVLESSLRFFG